MGFPPSILACLLLMYLLGNQLGDLSLKVSHQFKKKDKEKLKCYISIDKPKGMERARGRGV